MNSVMLDNVAHKDLKIITVGGEQYGDNVRFAPVVPSEFRQLSSCYPIVFRKVEESFEAVALLGFENNENLFLNGEEWSEYYVPKSIQRLPFSIGFSEADSSGDARNMIHIDMDHPRVSFSSGEDVFLPQGGSSEFLNRINYLLAELKDGVSQAELFFKVISNVNLIEPFTLNVELSDSSKFEMQGFYTINEDRLNALSKEQIYDLHKDRYLELIYMVVASLSNIGKLIRKKEAKLFG